MFSGFLCFLLIRRGTDLETQEVGQTQNFLQNPASMFSADQTNRFGKRQEIGFDLSTKQRSRGIGGALIDFKLFADETLTGFP